MHIQSLNIPIKICLILFTLSAATLAEENRLNRSAVNFTSSNLPIIVIDTHGQTIPTSNPRIIADMGVIDNGQGIRNQINDPFNNYEGKISIEIRGSSSAGWLKKSYGLETQNDDGSNRNVVLLGMPAENDWILYAPYYDRSLIRNVLTFHLVNQMGWYATRTRPCELVLNGDYQGVYVLMEKIKRDRNRVNIARLDPDKISGDDLTGGYIIKIDKEPWKPGFDSRYPPQPSSGRKIRYQFHYPKGDEIVDEQKNYIRGFIDAYETTMYNYNHSNPAQSYGLYLNVESFVDNFIINELSRNVDGYRLSTFFHKDKDSKGGKLVAGPAWDFNFSFGNVGYYQAERIEGWQLEYFLNDSYFHSVDGFQVPFWWRKLLNDTHFRESIYHRWRQLRQSLLHPDSLYAYLDQLHALLDEAQERNFEIWIGPGDPKASGDGWFPPDYPIRHLKTYADEINYLKQWMTSRMQWMDQEINTFVSLGDDPSIMPTGLKITRIYPNPFNATTTIDFELGQAQQLQLRLSDIQGREIDLLLNRWVEAGAHTAVLHLPNLASGVYLLRIQGINQIARSKIVLIK